MLDRKQKLLEAVRRGVSLAGTGLLCGSLLLAYGGPQLSKKYLVKVLANSESSGITISDRYIPQTKVREIIELTGVVAARGYVITFAGGRLADLRNPELHYRLSVRTWDGKGYPAELAGIDERLSLIYLKTPLPSELAVEYSPDTLQGNVRFVLMSEREPVTGETCLQERKTLSWLPLLELKLSGLDLKTSWDGAAVVDSQGRLLGLVTGAWPHPFSSSAVSEVIPAELLKASFDTVRKSDQTIRVGWLGVTLEEVEKRTVITNVGHDTPAAKAGLQIKDSILEVDGEPLSDLREFGRAIRSKSPDASCRLTIEREGQPVTAWVKLGVRPTMGKLVWKMELPSVMGGDGNKGEDLKLYRSMLPPLMDLGLVLDQLSVQLAHNLNSPIEGGLLIRDVSVGSNAEKAGFVAGDVIFMINGKNVFSLGDVRKSLDGVSRGPIEIRIVRERRQKILKVSIQ